MTIHTTALAEFQDAAIDTIIIPGSPHMVHMATDCEGMAQWLRENTKNARRTASVCSGVFVSPGGVTLSLDKVFGCDRDMPVCGNSLETFTLPSGDVT